MTKFQYAISTLVALFLVGALVIGRSAPEAEPLPTTSIVSTQLVDVVPVTNPVLTQKRVVLEKQELRIPPSRVITIFGEITGSVEDENGAPGPLIAQKIREMDDGKTPIYLVINSPGGSVIGGAQIITAMQESKSKIYTVCIEMCASMAFMIHQYGEKRYMLDRSIIMSHQASTGVDGEMEKIYSILKLLSKYLVDLDAPIARRAGLTPEQYKSLVSNQLWLDAGEATARNFNDAIVILRAPTRLFKPKNASPFGLFGITPFTPSTKNDDKPKELDFLFQYNKQSVIRVK